MHRRDLLGKIGASSIAILGTSGLVSAESTDGSTRSELYVVTEIDGASRRFTLDEFDRHSDTQSLADISPDACSYECCDLCCTDGDCLCSTDCGCDYCSNSRRRGGVVTTHLEAFVVDRGDGDADDGGADGGTGETLVCEFGQTGLPLKPEDC